MDFRKDTNKQLTYQSNPTNLTIFKDETFNFLYKKTERISTAIYLITNLMTTEEPIKWQLRKTTLNLLDRVMSLSNTTMSSRDITLRDISQKLFQLISLYGVAFRSGFISEMNYNIVNTELGKLADFLSEYDEQDNRSRNNLFENDFFSQNITEIDKGQIQKDIYTKDKINQTFYKTGNYSIKDNNQNNNNYKRHYKGQNNSTERMSDMNNKINQNASRDSDVNKTKSSTVNKYENKIENKIANKSHERNKRREDIINIIKQKGDVSVKDISSIIKDTSEKTIQRELISMVEDGVLLKEGERRWSRYMMSKQ